MKQKSWLGDNNIIDKNQDHHKSELQKMSKWQRRVESKSVLDLIDDKVGIDLFVIVLVFSGLVIYFIVNS